METNILYLPAGDVARTLNARASYPLDDSAKAFLVDCLTALQDQFGDPVQCCYREFPTDGETGSRRVHFACSKDADVPGPVNVSFVLEDPARAARAAGVLR